MMNFCFTIIALVFLLMLILELKSDNGGDDNENK